MGIPSIFRIGASALQDAAETRILVASDWAPIRAFEPIICERADAVYGDLIPLLVGADIRIVNCEAALTLRAQSVCKSGSVFKGKPEHVKGLVAVPFDLACLANNHVLDFGAAGLMDTLSVLRSNRIATVGAGMTEREAYAPALLQHQGQRVHVVNICEGEDLTSSVGGPGVFGWDIERASKLVRSLKKRRGVVIVIAHCGLEYVPFPPPYVVKAFRSLAEAGADCVIGHHPHVPQGVEVWKGKPIAYSLGNFVFFQATKFPWRKTGFCAQIHCFDNTIRRIDLIPYRVTPGGLNRLGVKEMRPIQKTMGKLSRPFQTASGPIRAWNAWLTYYGEDGFRAELGKILDKLAADPMKGAAMFRNRLTTMQHFEHWRTFLTRTMSSTGRVRDYSLTDYRLVEEWFTPKDLPPPPPAESSDSFVQGSADYWSKSTR